jgi:hypothetical protein
MVFNMENENAFPDSYIKSGFAYLTIGREYILGTYVNFHQHGSQSLLTVSVSLKPGSSNVDNHGRPTVDRKDKEELIILETKNSGGGQEYLTYFKPLVHAKRQQRRLQGDSISPQRSPSPLRGRVVCGAGRPPARYAR